MLLSKNHSKNWKKIGIAIASVALIAATGCQTKSTKTNVGTASEYIKIQIPSELATQHIMDERITELDLKDRLQTDQDGTQNMSLTEEEQKTLLDGIKEDTDSLIEEIMEDDMYGYITNISYDEKMDTVTIQVDKETWYEDSSISVCFFPYGNVYQIVNGIKPAEVETTVNFMDGDTLLKEISSGDLFQVDAEQ